jgi:hypothetical protein
MSLTRIIGFVGVSMWTSFVFGRIAAATASRSRESTYVNSMPNRLRTWLNIRAVPPYVFSSLTTWSPAERRFTMDSIAARPDANATPRLPVLQRGDVLLERLAGGVRGPSVVVGAFPRLADGRLHVRRRLEDRGHDGPGDRLGVGSGVDGQSTETEAVVRLIAHVAGPFALKRRSAWKLWNLDPRGEERHRLAGFR